MKYKLKELIDIKNLQEMTDELYKATGIPSAIIAMDGEILTGSGWQRICTDFHRKHPEIQKECIESDTRIRKELGEGKPFVIYKCPRGLVDASSPVIIEGEHVANVFTGQLFNEQPDASTEQFFRQQARKFGLDEEEYIKAYREIPVMTKEQYRNALSFLAKLAQMLGNIGLLRKQERDTSAQIEKNEKSLSTLFSRMNEAQRCASIGNWDLDIASGKVWWSDEMYRIFELQPDQYTPSVEANALYIHTDDRGPFSKAVEAVISSGNEMTYEMCIITGKGRNKYCNFRGKVERDQTGRPLCFFGTFMDITDRKKAEELLKNHEADLRRLLESSNQSRQALLSMAEDQKATEQELLANQTILARKLEEIRISEERYRTVVNTMSEGIILQTASGEIITSNAKAELILGLSSEQMRGRTSRDPIWQTIHEDGSPFPGETHPSMVTLNTGKPMSNVIMGIHKPDKTLTWISVNSEPITAPGASSPQAVITTFTDISDRKRAEEDRKALETQLMQAQRMESIGTLAGGIAHDFNNILMALIGYADSVYEKLPIESEARHDQEQVMKAAKRAKELVQQILTFSRKANQEQKTINLGSITKEALKLLRASIPTTIEIRQQIPDDIGTVMADPTAIHQVVVNLCTNAYHAMREKGGILCVTLKPMDIEHGDDHVVHGVTPGKYILMEFSDTGTGIEKDILDKIFDPYFTTKKTGEGTGLGLSVVHGIVKSLGGQITVYSEPEKGSTFRVYIPRLENTDKKAVSAAARTADDSINGTERILVVDDEEPIVELYRSRMNRLGYQVAAVTSSEQALDLFKAQPNAYDILVTDMTMPGLTGMELAAKVMAIRPDIPIILCTGFSDSVNGETAKTAGIREYVTKPVTPKDLARLIRKIVGAK